MKTQAIKPVMRAIFDRVAEKQFYDMQRNRPYYDAMLLNTPSGKEKQLFNVGDSVISMGTGTYKKGVGMVIIEAYEENGYWKYICGSPTETTRFFQVWPFVYPL